MRTTKIGSQQDKDGRLRYFVYPIESEAGFADLTKFVSQEFDCHLGELDEGPGTIVQRAVVEGSDIVFVLSDSTGTQFYSESDKGAIVSARIAKAIEARLREVM